MSSRRRKPREQSRILRPPAQPTEHGLAREPLQVFVATPRRGVRRSTGVVLVSLGFANPNANPFFVRLRQQLADRFDLIAVGVDYLGTRAKESRTLTPQLLDQDALIQRALAGEPSLGTAAGLVGIGEILRVLVGQDLSREFLLVERMPAQTPKDYIDFGVIQAVDLLTALHAVREAWPKANFRRVHIVASSLGAFLAHQALRLAPRAFASVLDISGKPLLGEGYLLHGHRRKALMDNSNTRVSLDNDSPYCDTLPLSLSSIDLRNQLRPWNHPCSAVVRMVTGAEDDLVPLEHKRRQQAALDRAGAHTELRVVGVAEVDGTVVKHAGHGLGAEFYQLILALGTDLLRDSESPGPGEFEERSSLCLPVSGGHYTVHYDGPPTLAFTSDCP